jgi:mannose-6-phosphate isomerase-like protein (cupin superfamily)
MEVFMAGYMINIEEATLNNTNFRKVLYTAVNMQLVVMSLKPGEEIGEEVHSLDQFFRFEAGKGKVVIDDAIHLVKAEDVVIVPAGSKHNVINMSDTEELKLYTIYAPPEHKDGTIHKTKDEADAAHELEHATE